MTSLCYPITTPDDANLVSRISSRRTAIFVGERDLYDYSAGEAPAHLKTVLRVLDVRLVIFLGESVA